MNTIDYKRLRKIIAEEVEEAMKSASEDRKLLTVITSKSSDLLNAIDKFEEECPESCMHSVSTGLSALKKTLEDMANHPGNYVSMRSKPSVRSDVDNLISSDKEED